jgi:hypothetical protein
MSWASLRGLVLVLPLVCAGCIRSVARESTAGALDAVQKSEQDARAKKQKQQQEQAAASGQAATQDKSGVTPSPGSGQANATSSPSAGPANAGGSSDPGAAPAAGPVGQVSATVASGAGSEVLDVVLARHADLRRLTGEMTGAATRAAVAELGPTMDRVVRQDLAANGPISKAMGGLAATATRSAIQAVNDDLTARLAIACPQDASLRDCLHRETRALSGEVVAGVVDELRWPLRVLAAGAALLTLGACAILALVFIRMLSSGTRGNAGAGQPLVPRGV